MTFARRNLMFPASSTLILAAYTVSIFVSALLLFSVQPLFTKMILPRLGGSPAVWSVAMVFFQSLLLGGYAYAHFLMTFRNRVIPVVIHLILLSIAFLTLSLAIGESWSNPPESGYQLWMLALFAGTVGLPFFALAANNPLLQGWFVRTGHPDGQDPYFLYASSNIGSFLALLSYPLVLEPIFSLRTQNLIWTGGYGLLILLIAACGTLLLRAPAYSFQDSKIASAGAARPSWTDRGHLDFSRCSAFRVTDCRYCAHFDRRRRRAPALGSPSLALSSNVGAGLPDTSAIVASVDTITPTACYRRGYCTSAGRRRSEPVHFFGRASHLLFPHRDGVPRRTRAAAADCKGSYRLLPRFIARWHAGRPVRRPDRSLFI
jgi:hypothetical protein